MAHISKALRQLWGSGRPSNTSASDPIARFDGANEDHTCEEQMEGAVPQQQHSGTEETERLLSPTSHRQAAMDEHAAQTQRYEQRPQLATFQNGLDQNHRVGLQSSRQIQYNDFTQRTGTAAIPVTPPQVKQELVTEQYNDQDLFAEFTNEDYHEDDAGAKTETQQALNAIDGAAPPIKTKPEVTAEAEAQLPADALKEAGTVDNMATVGHSAAAALQNQPDASSTIPLAEVALETGVHSETVHPSAQDSDGLIHKVSNRSQVDFPGALTDGLGIQHLFENQVSQKPNSQRSPSADSVIARKRNLSEETVSGIDLGANSHFRAQDWQQRQLLFGQDMLTAEAPQPTPSLLLGLMPAQQQYNQNSSNFPCNRNVRYPGIPGVNQNGLFYPQQMIAGYPNTVTPLVPPPVSRYPPAQTHTPSTMATSQFIAEVKEEEDHEASEDDEPLASHASRQRPTTGDPVAPHPPSNTSANAPVQTSSSGLGIQGVHSESIVEISDDDEAAEPISWKLPDFEATYHPAATDKDVSIAKISTLGQTKNLVREEIMLTEDHQRQEMQLFLDVFLPAQKALATPDPEPAHAVINFHTIAVMVLEAFVQYEIGDEMGRGYGFHSGNIAAVPRPSPAAPDTEPVRTRAAQDADVDEIFFAVVDRWRAGMLSGKETLKLIRGCQEFCDVALDVIHFVKQHGLLQPELKKRKERSDKGVPRAAKGGVKEAEAKGKPAGKRKAGEMEGKVSVKKGAKAGAATTVPSRKKAKGEGSKAKPRTTKQGGGAGLTVIPRKQ
ncbi:hypothetical protein C7974DRAFT_124267 [Boeremia exigua]|uniref:uncharacterized protein n=1 Tax=Boeremia exigua TaxID=749465 RepID=UPI001E8D98B5|nr:uncharacterized protein C7974DRAFT_124267 [Boeremia exigua]KAH6638972.1 hypothetical protein C7974DRAFT_124267 [Boeremia exigua]